MIYGLLLSAVGCLLSVAMIYESLLSVLAYLSSAMIYGLLLSAFGCMLNAIVIGVLLSGRWLPPGRRDLWVDIVGRCLSCVG